MPNIIPPKVPFDQLDAHALFPPRNEREAITYDLTNLAACCLADHLRTFGHRGYHMAALLVLAGCAPRLANRQVAAPIDEWLHAERDAWPELQDERGFMLARSFISLLYPDRAKVAIDSVADCPEFPELSRLIYFYSAMATTLATAAVGQQGRKWNGQAVLDAVYPVLGSIEPIPEAVMNVNAFCSLAAGVLNDDERLLLEKAWKITRKLRTPPQHEVKVGAAAPPEEVKLRRLRNGAARHGFVFCAEARRRLAKVTHALNAINSTHPFAKAVDAAGLLDLATDCDEPMDPPAVHDCLFSTFMSPEAFARFKQEGEYRDVWASGATWHKRYSDQPLLGRSFQEMRMFGERGDGITYGFLTTCDAWQDEVSEFASGAYGSVEVYWKPESVAKWATITPGDSMITPGDSMSAPFAVDAMDPAGVLSLCASVLAHKQFSQAPHIIASLSTFMLPPPRFIEFQCHRRLTPDDVEAVIEH